MGLVESPGGFPFLPTLTVCVDRIAAAKPRLLGLSIVCAIQLPAALLLARLVRERAPHIHITAGGAAITYLADKLADT